MRAIWNAIVKGYLRLVDPFADYLARKGVSPNEITAVGTFCSVAAGVMFGMGHISTAGWTFGLTAVFDVLDGAVARRSGRETKFGAFWDSTLDRIGDGAVLGGLLVFYASDAVYRNIPMVIVCLVGIIGAFLTSYTRARAEGIGIDAKVGMIQRPERVTLLSAPQAFFGIAMHGYVLMAIIVLLALTSWITVFQRIAVVYRGTMPSSPKSPSEPSGADAAPLLTGDRVGR